ncbi:MAG: phosphoenolpyruvate--protein phosphotransferase [Arenicellales bacterium WSBS_2016_MAG_OTU3]
MLSLHGAGVGSGIAIGTAYVVQRNTPEIPHYAIDEPEVDKETQRFRLAVDMARRELLKVKRDLPENAPSEVGTFIDAHLMMLDDPLISEMPIKTIRESKHNAEFALKEQADNLINVFEQMEDEYLRSKKTDVQQVVNRIQRELLNTEQANVDEINADADGQIIVTNDLTPADAVLLKQRDIKAFVTNLGGPISHTAILARSLRIPAIVGLHGAIRYIRHGELLIVDGKRGVIIVSPDAQTLAEYDQKQTKIETFRRELEQLRETPSVTLDGEAVSLMANVELPEDINEAQYVAADGVGLYRTEFLFMNRAEPPGEDEQYEVYTHIVETLKQPVTIRTLDIGADKQVDGGHADQHTITNPAMGLRAVRLCLSNPGLFRPQLRAILRASAHGDVQIMIPMISALHEVQQVLNLIAELKQELAEQNISFNKNILVGGMIEVPAAAIAADLFASKLDFLSIGTNDLIQYTLAIDRVNNEVNYLYDPLHPSVLRLIENTIRAADNAGIPVSMCGEMAGDVTYTKLLLGLGLRIFSMDPTNLLEVKRCVCESTAQTLRQAASNILCMTDIEALTKRVELLNQS